MNGINTSVFVHERPKMQRRYFDILPSPELVSSDEIKYQNINSVYDNSHVQKIQNIL